MSGQVRIGGCVGWVGALALIGGASWAQEAKYTGPRFDSGVPLVINEAYPAGPRLAQEPGDQAPLSSRGYIGCFGDVDFITVEDPPPGSTWYIFIVSTSSIFGGPLLDPVVDITDIFGNLLFFGNFPFGPVSNDDMGDGSQGSFNLAGASFLFLPGFGSFITVDFIDSGISFAYGTAAPFQIRIRAFNHSSCGTYLVYILCV
jgi:hypothetical protein